MPDPRHVLLFDAAPALAEQVVDHLHKRGLSALQSDSQRATEEGAFGRADAAVVFFDKNNQSASDAAVAALIDRLVTEKVATVVWGKADAERWSGNPLVDCVSPEASLDEVIGRLTTVAHYAPLVKGLERELHHVQRLGQQLNRYFREIDQEMRLAGRLQRDFLPAQLPQLPPLSFATLYRPASWVSGDLFDVFRVDERHVAVFLADAMGHGIAAGLMTMFLRQALIPKNINRSSYRLVNPAEAMSNLHESLLSQRLPNCQFVTAAYAVVDVTRLEMLVARGGHPYPLYLRHDGEISELQPSGGLLGVADVPNEFDEQRVQLNPGDKILFYTDGLEDVFVTTPESDPREKVFSPQLRKWAALEAKDFMHALNEHVDNLEGSLHPADDVTAVMLEVAG